MKISPITGDEGSLGKELHSKVIKRREGGGGKGRSHKCLNTEKNKRDILYIFLIG